MKVDVDQILKVFGIQAPVAKVCKKCLRTAGQGAQMHGLRAVWVYCGCHATGGVFFVDSKVWLLRFPMTEDAWRAHLKGLEVDIAAFQAAGSPPPSTAH